MSPVMSTDEYVRSLLKMYDEYKALTTQLNAHESQLAMATLRKDEASITSLKKLSAELRRKISEVSDSMTFASPLIWVRYKFEAYQNEAQPISTMHDLRLHCSKPGYICTKRFHFVNDYLRGRRQPTLQDSDTYADTLEVSHIYELLQGLSEDEKFIKEWQRREYYQINGRVAKWEME